jgi:hypothetical protein
VVGVQMAPLLARGCSRGYFSEGGDRQLATGCDFHIAMPETSILRHAENFIVTDIRPHE